MEILPSSCGLKNYLPHFQGLPEDDIIPISFLHNRKSKGFMEQWFEKITQVKNGRVGRG
jgi:hypothetical protein